MLNKIDLDPYVFDLLGNEELVDVWWNSPNKAFNYERPILADLEIVRDYLMWHCFNSQGS